MTKEQIEYNIRAFNFDVGFWRRKYERARKGHTMLKYQDKIDYAKHCLANNLDRLHRYEQGNYDPA